MAKVLVIIPHDRFRDEEFVAVMDELKATNNEVAVGSTHHTEAQGHFGLLVKPDVDVRFLEVSDYDAIILIGGRGVEEFVLDTRMMNVISGYYYDRKIIGAIGLAVEILAYAGVLTRKRVTCDAETVTKVEEAGAYYTGNSVEEDENIITASGVRSSREFAKMVVSALDYSNRLRSMRRARIT
jgi:protease I